MLASNPSAWLESEKYADGNPLMIQPNLIPL
jgi:hypothetical protein